MTARAALDKLQAECIKNQYFYAEVTLPNGAKLTVGAQFTYHLRFSTVTGERDIPGMNYDGAFALLNAPDAIGLDAAIAALRAERAEVAVEATRKLKVQLTKKALMEVAEFSAGVGPRGERY